MAWKLRKDKLKAGAQEAEAPTESETTPASPPVETEQTPVFDLSGSAFQPETVGEPDEEPELPSFLDPDQPVPLLSTSALVTEPEAEVIALEPLPTAHDPAETVTDSSFVAEPLPEFDSTVAPSLDAEPEAISVVPPAFSPDRPTVDQELLPSNDGQDVESTRTLTPEREAMAPGLVTTETETGLPRVAPFILDTPPNPVATDAPRMRSVVIRIGKLSATHFLTKDVTTIGRPDGAVQNYPDIEIDLDDGVSRRHAEIRHGGAEYTIVDVGSTNGTVLNGEMLTPNQPVALQTGDRIRVGERTELLFE